MAAVWQLRYGGDFSEAPREIVMAAVQKDGHALAYASYEFQADREIVMAAVQQDGDTLGYASGELQADRGATSRVFGLACTNARVGEPFAVHICQGSV